MRLPTGTILGHYEIRGLLGSGGMGEVYRAWDARLRREVAVKVLLPDGAADADRLRRFEQEARAAGALNHPNITAVYDVGAHDGAPYLVTERLEGETLRARLAAGTLPPAKAIEYGIQIARGLSAAHQRGIVHRDLKPENVFVCGDGVVKILDFGIAKLRMSSDPTGATESLQTLPGTIIGTAAYMSPEQIRGTEVDARSDIFALGVVLYEMLAGTRPFAGGTLAELQTAILRDDPEPLVPRVRGVNAATERLVRQCLEKRPDDRFESARDVAHALGAVALGTGASVSAESPPRLQRSRTAAIVASALLVGAAAGAAILKYMAAPAAPPTYTQLTFQRGTVTAARFAPDDETVVYSAAWNGAAVRVFTTRIGSTGSRDLGVEGQVLSVSPQGEMALKLTRIVSSAAAGTLAQLSLAGGAPREMLNDIATASWDADGRQLAVVSSAEGHGVVEYPAGHTFYRSPGSVYALCTLPEHRVAVFECLNDGRERPCQLTLVDAAGTRTVLSSGWADWVGAPIVWSPATREILFAGFTHGDAALMAATTAGRTRLVARVPGDFHLGDIDRRGRMLLIRNVPRGGVMTFRQGDAVERDLSWLDFSYIADISVDGRQLLLGDISGSLPGGGIALRKSDGSATVDLGRGSPLALSPDGTRILALAAPSPPAERLLIVPAGAGARQELRHASIPRVFSGQWMTDGQKIVVVGGTDQHRARLYAWDVDNTAAPRPFAPEGEYGDPVVAPDGRSVAARRAGAALSIYALDGSQPHALAGGRDDDTPLRWSADGKSLFVRRGGGMPALIDRIDLATGKRSPWRQLMPADRAGLFGISGVKITPDGTSYAYTFASALGTLYLVDGVR